MKKFILPSLFILTAIHPASAQQATATGTGVGVAKSTSTAAAVAVSGQGGQGVGSVQVTSNPSLAVTSTVPANQTIKNVPTEFAPGLAAAGLETCLGSVSGGGAFVGTGFSFGTTIPDPGCAARLDARTLWSFGLKKAAVARLCLNGDVYRAMPEVCVRYLPYYQQTGVVAPVSADPRLNAFANSKYTGGQILLVDGNTGKDRLCNDYDEPGQRCRVWAYTVTHNSSAKKLASRGNIAAPAAQPSAKPKVPDQTPTSTAEIEGSHK
jgi:hypothetical protein